MLKKQLLSDFKRFTAGQGITLAALIAFAAPVGAVAAGTQLKLPACEALIAWGGSVDPHDTYTVAPRIAVPKVFQEPQFSATFGLPALSWTKDDFQATKQAIDTCYHAARKRRDRAASKALSTAGRELYRMLPSVTAKLQRSKNAAETAKKEIDGLPNSAALDRGLEILLKINPAAPDTSPLHGLPRDVEEAVYHLARTLPALADSERGPIFKALAERRTRIEAGMSGDAEKAIAAAPASAAGVMVLLGERQQVARLPDGAARTRLEQGIDQRIKQIRDGLRQAKPAVWVPPACIDIYRWAGEPGANQGVAVGRNTIWQMLSDAHAVPIFGISVADWTDDNLAQFRKLQVYCHGEVNALKRQAAQGTLPADQAALVRAAGKAGWIDDTNRDSLFVSTRTTLLNYRKAVAALQAAEARIAALPDTNESLATLNGMRTQPALNLVGEKEWNHFRDIFNTKLHAIGAHAADAAIKGLADVRVAQLSDLAKLRDYAVKTGPTIPVQNDQQSFNAAYNRAVRNAATKLLPQFQAKLDAMPASPDGTHQARTAVAKLTGINDHGRLAGLQPLRDAVEKRTDAIIKTMRGQACDGLLSDLGVGGDAKQAVWDGRKGVALGDWICSLAEQGVTVSAYSGAGLFSSTSTVKVTMPHGTLKTFSMHQGEVLPGKKMLVGFEIKDANQDQKLTVDQWAGFAGGTRTGIIMDTGGCKRFANIEPDKVAAMDKPYWLQCGLQLNGLGKRGM